MTIEGRFAKLYSYVLSNFIGATTESVPPRAALPQPAPSDANSIWLAPNGNDGNAGTSALPKLTLAGAIAALTAGKPTVHIFRNAYVGDLEFAIGTETLVASRNIQVETGQIATLYTAANGDKLTISVNCIINGINFEERSGLLSDYMILTSDAGSIANDTIDFENCTFNRLVSDTGAVFQLIRLASSANIDYNISDCAFIGLYLLITQFTSVAGSVHVSNCAFIKPYSWIDGTNSFGEYAILIDFNDTLAGRIAAYQWDNILIYGFDNAFAFTGDSTLDIDKQTLTLSGCDISQCTSLGKALSSSGTDWHADLIITLSRPGFAEGITQISPFASSGLGVIVVLNVNNVPGSLPSLYSSELAGSQGDSTGFQLQRIGKPINGKTYAIDSPLIGAGPVSAGSNDIGPWVDDASLSSQGWNDTFTIEWKAESMSVASNRMNPSSIADVNGNIHTVDDGIRKTYTLDFGSGATYASNNDLRKLVNAVADRGSLKFSPRDGDNLFTDAVLCDTIDNGDTMTVTPTMTSGNPMIDRNWVGFWATINGADFYISQNTATKLQAIDKLGNGFPANGNYSFEVTYILVKSNQNDIVGLQSRFTDFICGGAFREGADDETTAFELQGYSIKLDEVEDPEETT